jgi:peroxiredoxin
MFRTLAAAVVAFTLSVPAFAAKVGEKAPDFKLPSSEEGKQVSLGDFKDKYVVLEWLNHGCPFVRKHYDSGNMQDLQEEITGKGVVWLSIVSSAPGKQGHSSAEEAEEAREENESAATAVLLDEEGTVGQAYGAKTTPHMFVIDPKGTLIYAGAIDDKPSVKTADVKGAKNYVREALAEAMAGKEVTTSSTKPYGCSVKYASN